MKLLALLALLVLLLWCFCRCFQSRRRLCADTHLIAHQTWCLGSSMSHATVPELRVDLK